MHNIQTGPQTLSTVFEGTYWDGLKIAKKNNKKKQNFYIYLIFLVKLLILIVISLRKSLACFYALWNVLIVFEKVL